MFRLQFPLRVVCIALASFLPIFSSAVSAQAKGDVYFGYSFVSSDPTFSSGGGDLSSDSAGRASLNGWEASASIRLLPWIRAVADVGAGYGTVPVLFTFQNSEKLNANSNLHTYLLGPRASVPVGRVTPFGSPFRICPPKHCGHAFVSNVGEHEGAFAFDLGGGLDFRLVKRLAWRIQADYLQTKLFSSTQHDPRIGTGIVLRF